MHSSQQLTTINTYKIKCFAAITPNLYDLFHRSSVLCVSVIFNSQTFYSSIRIRLVTTSDRKIMMTTTNTMK